MIQIDDKVISLDIFEKKFICDLHACHGECCVEGESGAPLEDQETTILEEIYDCVKPYLTAEAISEIEKQGKWVVDSDGDKVTPIINGAECVYAIQDDKGMWKCAIEQAFYDGKVSFKKPISCHLYPIRATQYKTFQALNYHEWFVCKPARVLGAKVGKPVYQFLKEPIIRKYGQAFFDELENVAEVLKKENISSKYNRK
jgi:Protein of unknown function (DUF3109).